jgi:hypothetical protein
MVLFFCSIWPLDTNTVFCRDMKCLMKNRKMKFANSNRWIDRNASLIAFCLTTPSSLSHIRRIVLLLSSNCSLLIQYCPCTISSFLHLNNSESSEFTVHSSNIVASASVSLTCQSIPELWDHLSPTLYQTSHLGL